MDLRIYDDFTPELGEIWGKLYETSTNPFNSSFEWCSCWFKHFGQGKSLFIVTGWENNDLQLVAPFYKNGNKLHALGSDFYDEFRVLCENQGNLWEFVNFLFEQNLELNLNFVASDSDFLKLFIRKNEQEKTYSIKISNFTPNVLAFKGEELKDNTEKVYKKLKRKIKKAKNDFNDEVHYDFTPEKNKKFFDEFINLHLQSWDTFRSQKARDFIEDLYLNHDFTHLSRLSFKNSGQSLAYDFGYQGPGDILYMNLRTYDTTFSAIAPGIFTMYYNLSTPEILDKFSYVDLGRGAMEYKYFFSGNEKIILNLKAELSWKRYKKIYYPLKTFKQKLAAIF